MAKIDRDQITDAALAVIERTGSLDDLTLTAISVQLGVTQPALYYHVGGLDDVWRDIGLAVRRRLADVLRTALVGTERAEAVWAVAHAWRRFGREHPTLYRSTDRHPVEHDHELEEAVNQVLATLADSLAGFDLRDLDRQHSALAMRAAFHGYVAFELGGGHPGSADDGFDHVVELLLAGVHGLEGAASRGH